MNSSVQTRRGGLGFTIVELIVVVAVLGILISLTVFYIGDWRGRAAGSEVKDNLANVAAAMEDARNFGTGYPATIPSTFTASKNVTVQLMSSTTSTYCVNGRSTPRADIQYYITAQSDPVAGICP